MRPFNSLPPFSRCLGPAAIAGIVAGAGMAIKGVSDFTSGSRQKKIISHQYAKEEEYQKKMAEWNWQRYNSPAAQVRAMRAAGVNPFVDSGVGTSPVTPNAAGPDMVEAADPLGDFGSTLMGGASTYLNILGASENIEKTQAERQYIDAQRFKTEAETIGIQNQNSIFEYTRQMSQQDLLSKQLRNAYNAIALKYAEAEKIADIAARQAEVERINAEAKQALANAAKTDADRVSVEFFRDYLKDKYVAETNVANASAGLSAAQTQTENENRENRKNLTAAQAEEAESAAGRNSAEAWLANARREGVEIDNEFADWLTHQKIERKPTESYYDMALDIVDRYLEYRGQNKKSDSANRGALLGLALSFLRYAK